jgi:hypothetical protein
MFGFSHASERLHHQQLVAAAVDDFHGDLLRVPKILTTFLPEILAALS